MNLWRHSEPGSLWENMWPSKPSHVTSLRIICFLLKLSQFVCGIVSFLWAKAGEWYQDTGRASDSPLGKQPSLGLNFSLYARAVKNFGPKVRVPWRYKQILLVFPILCLAQCWGLQKISSISGRLCRAIQWVTFPLFSWLGHSVCDKNISNCIASARGTVESLGKSLLTTTRIKTHYSRERPHATLRMQGWCLRVPPRRGAQPGANRRDCSLLSCEQWEW